MSSCCPSQAPKDQEQSCHPKKKFDYILWGSAAIIALSFLVHWTNPQLPQSLQAATSFGHSVYHMMLQMWWGIAIGIIFVGFLSQVPREFVVSILGRSEGLSGILRATLAGLLFDLCNHGILMVGMKIYERGANLGQVMAFLIASPWNSLSLTVILISLVGWGWTITFTLLSAVVAIISGLIFNKLVQKGKLPRNPHTQDLPADFHFWTEAKSRLAKTQFNGAWWKEVARSGVVDSRMIIRWLFFGVVLAGLIQTFVSTENLQEYFGPSLLGLALTLIATTVIEVCSEGSTPIAADLLNRAQAPGNAFTFLMAGVSTDYTEVMVIKDSMKSWKIALFLPLITVPQILALSLIINYL